MDVPPVRAAGRSFSVEVPDTDRSTGRSMMGRSEARKFIAILSAILLAAFVQTYLLGFVEMHTGQTASVLEEMRSFAHEHYWEHKHHHHHGWSHRPHHNDSEPPNHPPHNSTTFVSTTSWQHHHYTTQTPRTTQQHHTTAPPTTGHPSHNSTSKRPQVCETLRIHHRHPYHHYWSHGGRSKDDSGDEAVQEEAEDDEVEDEIVASDEDMSDGSEELVLEASEMEDSAMGASRHGSAHSHQHGGRTAMWERRHYKLESEFMTMWICKYSGRVLFELKVEDVWKKGLKFGVDAVLLKGQLAHLQVAGWDTSFFLMMKMVKKGVMYIKHDLRERKPEDEDYEGLWKSHQKNRKVMMLPRVGVRLTEDCHGLQSVLVDATYLVSSGFKVSVPGQIEGKTATAHPHNIDFTLRRPDGRWETRWSLYSLPEKVMSGREADDRVGYFLQKFLMLGDYRAEESWGKKKEDELINPVVRLIHRQRLPNRFTGKNEIHYYVDPSVPEPFWEATRQGIEAWQVGLDEVARYYDRNDPPRIIAHCPSDADWPKDYDVADIRFNTVSWMEAWSAGFALGLTIVDPRSGEILKANVVISLGWLESLVGRQILMGAYQGSPGLQSAESFQNGMRQWGEGDQDGADMEKMLERVKRDMLPKSRRSRQLSMLDSSAMFEKLNASGSFQVNGWMREAPVADEIPKDQEDDEETQMEWHRMAMTMWHASAARSPQESLSALQDCIKSVTMHEVGHTLGLRHNFRGSLGIPFEKLLDHEHTSKHGLSASVMDYSPPIFVSKKTRFELQKKRNTEFGRSYIFTPAIGEYDRMAIRYGYSKVKEDENCHHRWWCSKGRGLQNLALSVPEGFATDESLWSSGDPYISMFDASDDPIRWWHEQFNIVKEAFQQLLDRELRDGESWTQLGHPVFSLLMSSWRSAFKLSRFVGGVKVRRKHNIVNVPESDGAKDGQEAVSLEDQEVALKSVLDLLSNMDSWIPQWYKTNAVYRRRYYEVAPLHMSSILDWIKGSALFFLVNPWRLEQVFYSEDLPGAGKNRLHEWLLPTVTKELFDLDASYSEEHKLNDHDSGRVLLSLRVKTMHNLQAEYVKLLVWCYMAADDAAVGASVWLEINRIKHALIETANSHHAIHHMDIAYIVTVLTPLMMG